MAISRFKTSTLAQGLPKYQDVWDGISAVFDSDYELITRTTVGAGGAASVTFSSIPGTYKNLQIRCLTRGTTGISGGAPVYLTVNSDSGTNYSTHHLIGSGSSAYVDGHANASYILDAYGGFQSWSGGDTANCFGVGIIDILDYSNTDKYKTARALWGRDHNSTNGRVMLESGSWRNTNAITSLTFTTDATYGVSWGQYSSFALYGIKGI